MQVVPRIALDSLAEADVPEIQQIEQEIFTAPWPRNAYYNELRHNRRATYLVLRAPGMIVAYGGIWQVGFEAHVTTVGVRASEQRKGYGRAIFAALVERALSLGCHWVTLEVRPSNTGAIQLYEEFGFKIVGRRRGYYADNGEDAIVMWSDNLSAPGFQERFASQRALVDTILTRQTGQGSSGDGQS